MVCSSPATSFQQFRLPWAMISVHSPTIRQISAPRKAHSPVFPVFRYISVQKVYTPGDKCDVLVAMNAAALKTQYKFAKSTACIIIDTDAFQKSDLEKAAFKTDNPMEKWALSRMSSPPHLEDGERLPCRHRNGQQVHAEMPQYVCSRPGMLAVQPRSENSRRFHPREIRQKPEIAKQISRSSMQDMTTDTKHPCFRSPYI